MTWRIRATRILAAVMAVAAIGFGLFTIVFGIVSPDQQPHAFHNAIVAALLIVISAPPVVAIAVAPERPIRPLVMLTAIGAAAVGTMLIAVTIDPFTLPFVVLSGLLWALAADRSDPFPDGRTSVPLLLLSGLAAVALFPYAWEQAGLQRIDHVSAHSAFYHWVEMSFYAATIPLLAALASFRPRDYAPAGRIAGVALIVFGGSSLLFVEYASALSPALAWAVMAGGAVFLGAVEVQRR
jgi:hypothetical protein